MSGFAKLTSLVAGVEQITQLDRTSDNELVEVRFRDGKIAITRSTKEDIEAATKMLDEKRKASGGR